MSIFFRFSLDYVLWAGGQPDFQYPALGDSSDYMYGALGVASFRLELGEELYKDYKLFGDEVALRCNDCK